MAVLLYVNKSSMYGNINLKMKVKAYWAARAAKPHRMYLYTLGYLCSRLVNVGVTTLVFGPGGPVSYCYTAVSLNSIQKLKGFLFHLG